MKAIIRCEYALFRLAAVIVLTIDTVQTISRILFTNLVPVSIKFVHVGTYRTTDRLFSTG